MKPRRNPFRGLPQELFEIIANLSPPNSIKQIADGSLKGECANNILWRAIFATDKWINLAERLLAESPHVSAPGPILIGKNLSSIGDLDAKGSKHHHILLAPNDWTGDLRYNLEVFFDSLREDHRYLEKEHKIIFPRTSLAAGPGNQKRNIPGITLYIKNLITATEIIELPKKELKRLFAKESIQTQYTSSSLKNVQTIKPSDVCGMKPELSMPGDLNPICGLTFNTNIGPWQLVLRTPEANKWKLNPMTLKNGKVIRWTGIRKKWFQ